MTIKILTATELNALRNRAADALATAQRRGTSGTYASGLHDRYMRASATARKTIGSGAQPDRSPMMDHVGKRPRNT